MHSLRGGAHFNDIRAAERRLPRICGLVHARTAVLPYGGGSGLRKHRRIPEAVRSAYAAIPEYPDARSGSVADVFFPRHAGDQRRFADNTCSADDNTVPMPPGGYDPHGGPGNRRCQPRLHDYADGKSRICTSIPTTRCLSGNSSAPCYPRQ